MDKIIEYMPFLLSGTIVTIKIFVLTLLLSLPLGLPFALASNSKILPLKWFSKIYIWIFRGTPLILQLYFFYYFFPICLEVNINPFVAVILTFVLNYAAYFAEIYRGGIAGVDKGQYEAARTLGISKSATMKDIILPQTMKTVLPPIVNEAITLVKDSALASTIGTVVDLMRATSTTVNRLTDMSPFFMAALIYLMMTAVLTMVAGKIEKRFARYDA
ncbi:MAG: amino acid ABC transporter permease [Eubacterium sp.]|nr:amino acid ABC transporter permease [Eubacterium sp.]